ncbi:MAG: hypothetical protein JOZ42_10300 [Acetobacteraceae bacterium]|nr:hypothetical protein [Acetobacteraceae bacterium]
MTTINRHSAGLSALLGLGLLAAGCATQTPQDKVSALTAAGFKPHGVGTPKQVALAAQLPANELVRRTYKGRALYVYSDPSGCNCLYAGYQPAYDRYMQTGRAQAASMAQADAEFDEDAWGMGGWRD